MWVWQVSNTYTLVWRSQGDTNKYDFKKLFNEMCQKEKINNSCNYIFLWNHLCSIKLHIHKYSFSLWDRPRYFTITNYEKFTNGFRIPIITKFEETIIKFWYGIIKEYPQKFDRATKIFFFYQIIYLWETSFFFI